MSLIELFNIKRQIKSLWDFARLLFACAMGAGGGILLSMLTRNIFQIKSLLSAESIFLTIPFFIIAILITLGLFKLFIRFRSKCKNEWDFWMIMLSFSLAGCFIRPVRMLVFHLLGITAQTSIWIKILVYIPLIPPTYYAGLLVIGTCLGQKAFFMDMIASRIRFLTGRKNVKQ